MNSEHRHTSDMGRPERLIKRSGWPATFCPNLPLKRRCAYSCGMSLDCSQRTLVSSIWFSKSKVMPLVDKVSAPET